MVPAPGDDPTGGQAGILATLDVLLEAPVVLQDAAGAVGFVVVEFDAAHQGARLAVGRPAASSSTSARLARVVVDADELLIRRTQVRRRGA